MRRNLIPVAVDGVLRVIPAPSTTPKEERIVPVTDIVTRRVVERTPAPTVTTVPKVAKTDEQAWMLQDAQDRLAEIHAGMEGPNEIRLTPAPQPLDPNYMQQIEQQAA